MTTPCQVDDQLGLTSTEAQRVTALRELPAAHAKLLGDEETFPAEVLLEIWRGSSGPRASHSALLARHTSGWPPPTPATASSQTPTERDRS